MYRRAQEQDETCSQVRECCRTSWPKKQLVPLNLIPYWNARNSLTICNKYNSRIVVPKLLQQETLERIHSGHLGIEKCKRHTATSVWWPGVMQRITQLVQNCRICAKESRQGKEPLMTSETPKYPWQVVGTDLFEL